MDINQTLKQPGFAELQANDLVTTRFYENREVSESEERNTAAQEVLASIGATADDATKAAVEADAASAATAVKYDWLFAPSKKITLPFATVRVVGTDTEESTDTEEMDVYNHKYERYGNEFADFCERAKAGRKTEQLVYYWLTQAGVVANLETMVLDGDTSIKAPDITVRAAQPDDNGDYQWYSLEVKTTTLDYEEYSDNPSTFPKSIRVDSVRPYDQKRKTCTRNDAPLIGVVKVHSTTGGVLFIPDSTRERWEMKHQTNKWKEDTVYWADGSCLRSFAALVEKLGGNLS